MGGAQPRVFFVDNNKRMVQRWDRIFRHHGYTVRTFAVQSEQWLDGCLHRVRLFRPHVIIADMRLEDDDRIDDTNGLTLLRRVQTICPGLPFIIYSAFLDVNLSRQVVNEGGTIVSKGESPNELLDVLKALSAKVAHIANPECHLFWPANWDEAALLQYLLPTSTGDLQNQPGNYLSDMVMQALFDKSHLIGLTPLEPDHNAQPVTSERLPGFVAGINLNRIHLANLIRVTNAASINAEQAQYDTWLETRSNNTLLTELIDTHTFWDLGISVYRLTKNQSGILYCYWNYFANRATVEQSLQLVTNFYKKEWHSAPNNIMLMANSIFSRLKPYSEVFAEAIETATDQFPDYLPAPPSDLSAWIEQKNLLYPQQYTTATIHGSFHCDNLFTDGKYLWSINFEKTAVGPQYQDFCALECDFVIRAACVLDDEIMACLLMAAVTNLHLADRPALPEQLSSQTLAAKVVAFITSLRQFAYATTNAQRHIDYYGTMLGEAMALLQETDPSSKVRKYALWFAVLLCERCNALNHPIQLALSFPTTKQNGGTAVEPGSARARLRTELLNIENQIGAIETFARDIDLKPGNINFQGTAKNVWQNVLREAELQGKLKALVAVVAAEYPNQSRQLHPPLTDLLQALGNRYQEVGEDSEPPMPTATTKSHIFTWQGPESTDALERIWSSRSQFREANFLDRIQRVAKATGRVEYTSGGAIGTGFLVGPDLLLTNHHVLPVNANLTQRQVRFGYRLNDQDLVEMGTTHTFSEILASSPNTELDFTLVRLTEAVGADTAFGHVTLVDRELNEDDTLYIVQHPDGRPQQIALSSDPVVYIAPGHRRVQYLTDTEHGSSGAPVCNHQGFVVALHHSGSPHPRLPAALRHIHGNEGIPIKAILPELAQYLGSEE